MSSTEQPAFDRITPDRLHERDRWTASADAWDRWADPMAELAQRLNQPLLQAAGVTAHDRVLDLASGAGEPALSAARIVGPDGQVVGTDLVPAMLSGAIRRAGTAGLGSLAFAATDMEALPFADGCFDRVTCRFGIMFVPSPEAALAECRRVLRPGGQAAFMVWGAMADNTLFDVVNAAVVTVLGPHRDPRHDFSTLFRFATPDDGRSGGLEALMAQAGFHKVTGQSLRPVGKVPVERPFWQATLDMTFGPRLQEQQADTQDALKREIRRRFAVMARDGTVDLSVHARIVTGVRT